MIEIWEHQQKCFFVPQENTIVRLFHRAVVERRIQLVQENFWAHYLTTGRV